MFNFEGGCYAKVIRLNPRHEPEIHRTTRVFGTVLENVVCDEETRILDLDSDAVTENTRAAYPITHLPNVVADGLAGHPQSVVFLTADAFGVLPPIARLDAAQAQYYFLSGYTAKVAGTERGIKAPQATFSACFGEPFLPRAPRVYAELLGERIRRHGPRVWLINTGWTGGPHGTGHRIPIPYTRAMVRAVLSGELERAEFARTPRSDSRSRAGWPRSRGDPPPARPGPTRRVRRPGREARGMFRDQARGRRSAGSQAAGPKRGRGILLVALVRSWPRSRHHVVGFVLTTPGHPSRARVVLETNWPGRLHESARGPFRPALAVAVGRNYA